MLIFYRASLPKGSACSRSRSLSIECYTTVIQHISYEVLFSCMGNTGQRRFIFLCAVLMKALSRRLVGPMQAVRRNNVCIARNMQCVSIWIAVMLLFRTSFDKRTLTIGFVVSYLFFVTMSQAIGFGLVIVLCKVTHLRALKWHVVFKSYCIFGFSRCGDSVSFRVHFPQYEGSHKGIMNLMSAIPKNVINVGDVVCFRFDLYRAVVRLVCTAISIYAFGWSCGVLSLHSRREVTGYWAGRGFWLSTFIQEPR